MRRVVLPGTEVSVSRLAFGTAHLHHVFSAYRRHRLLETALARGITHFDTSPYYGFGLGESSLGQFVRRHLGQITITSKVGLYSPTSRDLMSSLLLVRLAAGKLVPRLNRPTIDWSVKRASASLELTLRRLGCETLDFLTLHEPVYELLDSHEFMEWLEQARKAGKIRYWGLAGELTGSLPWIRKRHPLAAVIQTRDSLEGQEANALLEHGRAMQFTYGYLSAAKKYGGGVCVEETLRRAFARNSTGSIIIASRSEEHLVRLAKVSVP